MGETPMLRRLRRRLCCLGCRGPIAVAPATAAPTPARGRRADESRRFALHATVVLHRLRRHASPGCAENTFPLKRWSGVLLVGLHVIVPEHALVVVVLRARKRVSDQHARFAE